MLPRIKIVQVGDVHLPSAAGISGEIDVKDRKFPPALVELISKRPLKTVFKKLYDLIACKKLDAVLFMGDFTDLGQLVGYKACANFISRALQIGTDGLYSDMPLGIVPGNHDIDRNLAGHPSLTDKFQPLAEALHSAHLPEMPINSVKSILLEEEGAALDIHLVNSCWGCGEPQFIPEIIRQPIKDALDKALAGATASDALKSYYDQQLDTPAMAKEAIDDVVERITNRLQKTLPIVVAHHNLLPQRIPRLAQYTELVNGGALRSSLAQLNTPVLYLHGHIHEDPIEIVHQPSGEPLVIISAPEAASGFNILDVTFTRTSLPLVCHVVPYRFDAAGTLRARNSIRVPLIGARRRSNKPLLARFYGRLVDERECYWPKALSIARELQPDVTGEEVEETLELLMADGSIEIPNHNHPADGWIVRAEI